MQLRPYYDEFKALNTEVIVISFETGYWVQVWLAETEAPFPLLLDPDRRAYQAYGLGRSLLRSWSPKNLWYYTKAWLKGRRVHPTGADTTQLGGDFIIDTNGIVRLAHRSQDPTDRPSVAKLLALIGEPAPDFTLTSLAGQPIALSDYRGKVVLVNFWATWCPSCISELPDYEQVYQQHGGSAGDFVILGVNLQESQSQVEDYSTGLGVTFPVLLDTDGNVTTRQYQVTGMPGSFIIDRQGIIFYRHVGPLSAETLQAKLAELGL